MEIAAGGEVMDQTAVQVRQPIEGEVLQGLVVVEVGLTQERVELLLIPAGDFVLEQEGEELGIGQLPVNGAFMPTLRWRHIGDQ
jgi:hypothetical protein